MVGLFLYCASFGKPVDPFSTPVADLVYPEVPSKSRIRFVCSVTEEKSLFAHQKVSQKVLTWIFGRGGVPLAKPMCCFMTTDNRLLVTDTALRGVHIFNLSKRSAVFLDQTRDGPFISPIGVAADPAGRIYVSDSSRRKVYCLDNPKKPFRVFIDADMFERPSGMAFNQITSQLYVADTLAHCIKVFNRAGQLVQKIGHRGSGPVEFNFPTHLFTDDRGALYVTDSLNFRVQILSADGEFISAFGELGDSPGFLNRPKGVAVDPDGNIYVVDSLFDNVQIFNRQGELLLFFGEPGSQAGEFWLPAGIFIDARGRIYVADSYNQRLQVFEYVSGKVENNAY